MIQKPLKSEVLEPGSTSPSPIIEMTDSETSVVIVRQVSPVIPREWNSTYYIFMMIAMAPGRAILSSLPALS